VNRVPHWATVPIFVAITAGLVIASWRGPVIASIQKSGA
jgi:hypothetical protein